MMMMKMFWPLVWAVAAQARSDVAGEVDSRRVIVRLCHGDHEAHREHVSRHIESRRSELGAHISRHVRHLSRLPAVVVSNASEAVIADLVALEGKVCGVSPARRVVKVDEDALNDYVRPVDDVFWHVDRLNGPIDGDGANDDDYGGDGVNIFILDTGTDTAHAEFSGESRTVANVASFVDVAEWQYRPEWGWDDAPDDDGDLTNNDGDGHGTHCAGTCCGATTGSAPRANVFGIKVLDDTGSGYDDWIVAGLDAVAELKSDALADEAVVVSMSLGGYCYSGDPEDCMNDATYSEAINSLVDLGVAVIVAAGNDDDDACFYLPSAVTAAVTVGATTLEDQVASYSNWGACVDVMAPGDYVASAASSRLDDDEALLLDDGTYYVLSGTSMAAPPVAGAVAQYAQALGVTNTTIAANAMLNAAVSGELAFDENTQAADCETNDLLARTPQSGDALDVAAVASSCPVPESRDSNFINDDDFNFNDFPSFDDDDDVVLDVDEYDAADVGYCSSDLDQLVFGATTAKRCWQTCESQYPDTLVAADFYAPFYCYCQDACDCMIALDPDVDGSTLVAAGFELPASCDDDDDDNDAGDVAFDTYDTDVVGWCYSDLNVGYQFNSDISAEECWDFCETQYDDIVSVDFYPDDNICFCQDDCTQCVESTDDGGVTLVQAGYELPCGFTPTPRPSGVAADPATTVPTVARLPTRKPTTAVPTAVPTRKATTTVPTAVPTRKPTTIPTQPSPDVIVAASPPPTIETAMSPTRETDEDIIVRVTTAPTTRAYYLENAADSSAGDAENSTSTSGAARTIPRIPLALAAAGAFWLLSF